MNIVEFDHHGTIVKSRESLKGRHREYCLCHSCDKLKIEDRKNNCPIANQLYDLDCKNQVTTPVFYCPNFEKKDVVGDWDK